MLNLVKKARRIANDVNSKKRILATLGKKDSPLVEKALNELDLIESKVLKAAREGRFSCKVKKLESCSDCDMCTYDNLNKYEGILYKLLSSRGLTLKILLDKKVGNKYSFILEAGW
jgi:hypothetical protein